MHPILNKLTDTITSLRSGGRNNGQIAPLVGVILPSDALALDVTTTPTSFDDLILGALKRTFPVPNSAATFA